MTALLDEKLSMLERAGVAPSILAHFRAHILEAAPPGLIGLSPFRMADAWGLPRYDVLEAFLWGTRIGLFDLAWNVRCPSCKGITEHVAHLTDLHEKTHCEYCQLDFEAGFDEIVEVSFNINPNIRPLEKVLFADYLDYWHLFGEPTPITAAPQRTTTLLLTLQPGTYYLDGPHCGGGAALLLKEGPKRDEPQPFNVAFDGERLFKTGPGVLPAGDILLHIENRTDEPLSCALIPYIPYPWVSAATVAATQSFRDLFASELISPDETFAIRDMAFVFTDIRGSTALYERLGDSQAYYLVKEHFRILTDVVKQHHGAVVKTIGDAVMATFMVSTDAAQALFTMQEAFQIFNASEKTHDEIIIKVGAHRGPCIAVTSNDRLDYFGRTVNIAARVQGLSTGGDIMLTESFYAEPDVKALVDRSGWWQERFVTHLRGLQAEYNVIHLTPPGKP